jgi:hypothetical protein
MIVSEPEAPRSTNRFFRFGIARTLTAAGRQNGIDADMNDETEGWPVWKLSLLLYVFAMGAVAINLFMLGLLAQAVGFTALSPMQSLVISIFLGVPAAWAAGRWVRHLLDEAR